MPVQSSEPLEFRLRVYDVLGREVVPASGAALPAGGSDIPIDVRSLPSGLYLYRLEAGKLHFFGTVVVRR